MIVRADGFTRSLFFGLFHHWEPGARFMYWTAHIDESGTHSQSPILVMAAVLASAEKWEAFDAEWEALLAREALPHFHFTELTSRKRPRYDKYNSTQAQALIDECSAIVERHLEMSCVSILRKNDFNRLYKHREWKGAKIGRDSAIGVLFRATVSWIPEFLARAGLDDDPKINFIYEAGVANSGDIERLYALFKKRAPEEFQRRLGTLTFAGKGEARGLEAADCLALGGLQQERTQHQEEPSRIEDSAFTVPTQDQLPPGAPSFRLAIGEETLNSLYDQVWLDVAERRRSYTARRATQQGGA
jgi:hypothetical protein